MSWPSFQQLRYLVAIADTGSFAAAADEEFVSQPALSAQIKELERKLGVTLLERSNRGTMLTSAGEAVVERARTVLREMDDLVRTAQFDGTGLHGRVVLGVIPTIAPYLLPDVVARFTESHPAAQLHIRELRTGELLESLRRGEIDFGLLALPVDSPEFSTSVVRDDGFVLAVPDAHQLAKGTKRIPFDAIRDERVILLEEGHCLRDQAAEACRLAVVEPSEVQATSMSALAQMVAAGMGVTLLPECAVPVEAGPGRGISVRRFTGVPPSRTLGLVWRRSTPHGPVFGTLAESLRT